MVGVLVKVQRECIADSRKGAIVDISRLQIRGPAITPPFSQQRRGPTVIFGGAVDKVARASSRAGLVGVPPGFWPDFGGETPPAVAGGDAYATLFWGKTPIFHRSQSR